MPKQLIATHPIAKERGAWRSPLPPHAVALSPRDPTQRNRSPNRSRFPQLAPVNPIPDRPRVKFAASLLPRSRGHQVLTPAQIPQLTLERS
jgi:hypothetical protein